MSVKLLTEHRLEFVSFKGFCTGSSLVRMPHCVAAQFMIYWLRVAGYFHFSKKRKNSDKYHKSSFPCKQCAVHARVHSWSNIHVYCFEVHRNCFFFMQSHEKETQLGNYVWCAKSVFVRQFPPRATPSLKTTTTRGLIVGFFDLKPCPWTITLSLCLRLILLAVPGPAPPPPPLPQRGCDKLI